MRPSIDASGTQSGGPALPSQQHKWRFPMKGALAWLIGIPIPVIILLYVFDVF